MRLDMKRIARLKNTHTGEIDSYPSIADLVRRNGEKTLGISLHALYNALSVNNGEWTNKNYTVYYETVDLGNREWQ